MLNLSKIVSGDEIRQSPIRKIMEMADKKNIIRLGLNPDDVISFAGGWVNHEAPEELRKEYQKIADDKQLFHKIGGYSSTEGDFDFRSELVNLEKKIYGVAGLTPDNIIVGQSSTQLLFGLFMALLDSKDKVLVFDPTYANFIEQLHVFKKRNPIIGLEALDSKSWTFIEDEEKMLRSLKLTIKKHKPKVLLVSSPDNPTGQVLSDALIKEMLQITSKSGIFMLIDNAYRDQYFTSKQPDHFSFSPENYPNLITIHSNSKWCRGLGRRLGWLKASKKVITAMKTIQQVMVLCPDTMHQFTMSCYLKAGLKDGSLKKYLKENRLKYKAAAETTSKCIDKYLGMRYLKPQGGLYTVVDVRMDGEKFVQNVLKKTGVIFVPGGGFGKSLRSGIRVSFGPLVNNLDRIEEGFSRVKNVIGTIA